MAWCGYESPPVSARWVKPRKAVATAKECQDGQRPPEAEALGASGRKALRAMVVASGGMCVLREPASRLRHCGGMDQEGSGESE
ncbi:hypothetical protein TREES_T100020702 [Tupaia chinensis]|uniref:Uncharacterized protein n=1 Tax=Tupaia chinensis TaxID=246437 RepID=L9KM58_TUPCH|nr:hypothetical protein TREES_T100020702 [Tupaia chinensis]